MQNACVETLSSIFLYCASTCQLVFIYTNYIVISTLTTPRRRGDVESLRHARNMCGNTTHRDFIVRIDTLLFTHHLVFIYTNYL